jgi:hypothetical protein
VVEILVSVSGAASVVTDVLTAVLVLAVTVAVVMLVGGRFVARRRGILVVTELAAGGELQTTGYGAAATNALKVRLEELRLEDAVRVDLATGASGELKLPAAVGAQLSQASLIDAVLSLIDLVLPPNEWRLSGYLEPATNGQVAISLTLNRGRRVAQATSLRESDFSTGDPERPDVVSARPATVDYARYARLITPAAVWLYYQTRELTKHRHSAVYRWTVGLVRKRAEAPAPFCVTDWQSYALTAIGAELQAADNANGARTLYAQALSLEPKNRMAIFNLGVLDIRDGTRNTNERLLARGRLRFRIVRKLSTQPDAAANARTAKGGTVRVKHDGLWCRATYNMALANILMGKEGDLGEAASAVSALMQRLTAIQDPKGKILGEDNVKAYRASMETFADELEPQVLILAAGLLQLRDDDATLRNSLAICVGAPPDDKLPAAMIDLAREKGLNYRGHYNLAAYYARHGDREQDGSVGRTRCYRLALDELEACFEAATKDLKTWAQDDPSFVGLRDYDDPDGAVKALFHAPQGAGEQGVRSGSRA